MNIEFTGLSLENFRSIDKITIKLDKQGIVIVEGINEYENNASSNGSGKSSLFEGLIYALFEETSSGEKDVENRIIGNGFRIKLDFLVDNIKYTIYREGKKGKSSVILYKDNIDISARTKTETNKMIINLLGISKDIFLDSIFLSQNAVTNLASLPPTARRERLEVLTNTDNIINNFKEKIKEKQKLHESEALEIANQYYNIEGQIKSAEGQKDKINLKIKEIDQEIERLKQLGDIKEIETSINEKQEQIDELNNNIINNNQMIQKLEEEKQIITENNKTSYNNKEELLTLKLDIQNKENKIETNISKIKLDIHLKEEKIADINKEINKIKNSDTCPTCGRKYENFDDKHLLETIATKNLDIENINTLIKELNNNIEMEEHNLQEIINENIKNEQAIENINKILKEIEDKIQSIESNRLNIDKINQENYNKINLLQNEINILQNKKEQILKTTISNKQEFLDMITDIEKEIETLNIKLSEKKEESTEKITLVETCKHIIQLITKDFRTYLLKNSLQYLNKLLIDYSNRLFSNTGDIIMISEDDNKLDIKLGNASYESLSGGEKTRVNIALLLAQKSLANMIGNISCNIIILDEILGYCDSTAETKIIDLITKELDTLESIYMISHKEIPIGYDSIITIVKDRNGLSRIRSY